MTPKQYRSAKVASDRPAIAAYLDEHLREIQAIQPAGKHKGQWVPINTEPGVTLAELQAFAAWRNEHYQFQDLSVREVDGGAIEARWIVHPTPRGRPAGGGLLDQLLDLKPGERRTFPNYSEASMRTATSQARTKPGGARIVVVGQKGPREFEAWNVPVDEPEPRDRQGRLIQFGVDQRGVTRTRGSTLDALQPGQSATFPDRSKIASLRSKASLMNARADGRRYTVHVPPQGPIEVRCTTTTQEPQP